MSHLFFSYARKNADDALRLINGLRTVGFVIWQDVSHIKGGEKWINSINKNIAESDGMLVLWSQEARASEWVGKEIDQALLKGIPIYPLLLDDTPLDDRIAALNGTAASNISKLISELPVTARRKRLGFDPSKPMNEQSVEAADQWNVDGDPLISVPLFQSSYCKAAVIARPEVVVGQPRVLQLCLHFTRGIDKVLVSDVYRQFKHTYPDETFVALHITGPTYLNQYRMDDHNNAHWSDAVDTTFEAVSELSQTRRPELHVYSQSILALNFALGAKFWRFWKIYLYNWASGDGEIQYNPVIQMRSE